MNTQDAITSLTEVGELRVWSLLITILGDAAPASSNEVSGPWLNQIFHVMHVSPQAFRVAAHRLKKDDWIQSRKDGRISHFSLSSHALLETQSVWDLIYNTRPEQTPSWSLCLLRSGKMPEHVAHIKIGTNAYAVRSTDVHSITEALVTPWENQELPNWINESDDLASVVSLAHRLNEVLVRLTLSHQPPSSAQESVERHALRFLALHYWRKIALREAAWFHMQHVPDSVIELCRNHVQAILQATDHLKSG